MKLDTLRFAGFKIMNALAESGAQGLLLMKITEMTSILIHAKKTFPYSCTNWSPA